MKRRAAIRGSEPVGLPTRRIGSFLPTVSFPEAPPAGTTRDEIRNHRAQRLIDFPNRWRSAVPTRA
jgi:hypothetical protein